MMLKPLPLVFLTCLAVHGQTPEPEAQTVVSVSGPGYHVAAGDVLSVRIYGRPQLQRDVRVEMDGTIRMPLISEPIPLVCKTESEAASEVASRYTKYLVDPQVTVNVKEFSSQPVEVTGSVARPGPFQLHRNVRLRELLSRAGGLTPAAGQSVQVIHDEETPSCDERAKLTFGGGQEPAKLAWLSLDKVMSGSQGSNPYIWPGDLINVPAADLVYVVGNVVKPSSMPLTKNLLITRAIAMAGGTLAASKSYVRVMRSSENGMNEEIKVDLQAIRTGAAPDFALQAGDIVDVPLSQGKQLLKGAVSAVTSMGPLYYPLTIVR
jgi:polysaccharide biosynthesis/export protein